MFTRHDVTMAGGSTAFYLAFLNEQRKHPSKPVIPSLRLLTGGGAPKPPEVFCEVQREMGIPICHGYGMTECPMITQGSPDDTDEQLANTDGAPVHGCEVQVVDDDGAPVAAGRRRRGARPRADAVPRATPTPRSPPHAFDADGFFRTGDLGYLRDDGHVVLTGRTQGRHHPQGREHQPTEIEDLLQTHPKVADVAVIGLPDRERGERVCAVVETAGDGAADVRRDAAVLPRRRADDPEDPRAARGRRRAAAQRDVQDPQARAGRSSSQEEPA